MAATAVRAGASALAGWAAGAGLLSARVAALVKGVNRAMFMKRMRTAALWLLGSVVVGSGVGLSVVATRGATQTIPRAEAKGPPQAEGKSSGGEGRHTRGDREAPALETHKREYLVEVIVIEPDPHGKDLGPLGRGKIVEETTLSPFDGMEAGFFRGSEIPAPGGAGVPAEFLHTGLGGRVKVSALRDGRVYLEAVLERSEVERADENGAQVRSSLTRAIAPVKFREAVKLVDKDDNGKVRHVALVKVVSEKTVISQTRSAAAVEETRTGNVRFGVGVNSDAGLTGSVHLNERNFDIKPAPTGTHKHPNDQGFRGAGQEFRLLNGLEYQVPVRANDKLYHVGFVDSGTVDQPPSAKRDPHARPDSGTRRVIPAIGPVPVSIDFGFPVRKE